MGVSHVLFARQNPVARQNISLVNFLDLPKASPMRGPHVSFSHVKIQSLIKLKISIVATPTNCGHSTDPMEGYCVIDAICTRQSHMSKSVVKNNNDRLPPALAPLIKLAERHSVVKLNLSSKIH